MELIYYSSDKPITELQDTIFINGEEIKTSNNRLNMENKNSLFCIAKGVKNYDYGNFASRQLIRFFNEKEINSKEELISTLYEYKRFLEKRSYEDYIEDIIVKEPQFAVIVGGILKLDSELIIFNIGNILTYRILVNKIIKLSKEQNIYSDLYYHGLLKEKENSETRKGLLTSFISNKGSFDIYFNQINLLKNDKLFIVNDFMYETLENDLLDIFTSNDPIKKIELLIKKKQIKNEAAFIFIKN